MATNFVQFEPEPGAEPSPSTEVRILYTDEAVFVGARMFDSAPDSIVARLARRDEPVISDRFVVGFDSYYDRRTAFGFAVTAGGAESDFLLYDDTDEDRSWDAVWDVATRIDERGWTAEFRIPLSQLRFSVREGEDGIWGVNFQRDIARREEEDLWSPFPDDRSRMV